MEPGSHEAATRLAAAGWDDFNDRLVRAVCHDLNGRLTGLWALAHLYEAGNTPADDFALELERLEAVGQLLASSLGAVEKPAMAFAADTLLASASALYALTVGSSGSVPKVEVAAGLPPILVNEGRFIRLATLFTDLAARSGSDTITLSGGSDGVEISFAGGSTVVPPEAIVAMGRVAELDGGSLDVDAGRCTLSLPSLSKARAGGG